MLEEIFPKLIMGLYDEVMDSPNFEDKAIAEKCLDFLDVLFEKEIGSAKKLSIELMNR
jgi:dihydrodipicolinate synthase/N-acetylneuraminate lyase